MIAGRLAILRWQSSVFPRVNTPNLASIYEDSWWEETGTNIRSSAQVRFLGRAAIGEAERVGMEKPRAAS
jgi:hypothetical protein